MSGRAVWAGGGRRALQRWRQPPVGVPSVVLLLVVLAGLVLGAASLGGWGGVALVVAVLAAVVALVYLWCDYRADHRHSRLPPLTCPITAVA